MATLHKAVDLGINFFDTADVYGVSVERVEQGLKAVRFSNVQSVQIIFNIFRQRPMELFFEQAIQREVGVLARVPLASGLLNGQVSCGQFLSIG